MDDEQDLRSFIVKEHFAIQQADVLAIFKGGTVLQPVRPTYGLAKAPNKLKPSSKGQSSRSSLLEDFLWRLTIPPLCLPVIFQQLPENRPNSPVLIIRYDSFDAINKLFGETDLRETRTVGTARRQKPLDDLGSRLSRELRAAAVVT